MQTLAKHGHAANNQDGGEGTPVSPFLYFPYDGADNGAVRPYPAVPAWMCQGIHVNGLPYTGTPLIPGTTLNLSVVIANRGATEGVVTARLYAAPPAPVFTHTYLGPYEVTPGWVLTVYPPVPGPTPAPTETPPLPWVVPTGTNHMCLVAEVICAADPPTLPEPDAAHDRHYGQQNLSILMMGKSERSGFIFHAVNPLNAPVTAIVRALPARDETLRFLSQLYHAEPLPIDRRAMSVYAVQPGARISGRQEPKLELKAKESRLCQLMIEAPASLEPHQFFAIEIEQELRTNDRSETAPVPTLGVVVFGKNP